MAKLKAPEGLSGPGGLIAAVIGRAVTDIYSPDPDIAIDALVYLGSRHYQRHLQALDLAPDFKPVALAEMPADEFINMTEKVFNRSLTNE